MTPPHGSETPGGTTTFGVGPARASTLADRAGFLTEGFAPHSCQTCGLSVLVRKTSQAHTSIQWTDSADRCPNYQGPGLMGCRQLSESIAAAAKAGDISVRDEVPDTLAQQESK